MKKLGIFDFFCELNETKLPLMIKLKNIKFKSWNIFVNKKKQAIDLSYLFEATSKNWTYNRVAISNIKLQTSNNTHWIYGQNIR